MWICMIIRTFNDMWICIIISTRICVIGGKKSQKGKGTAAGGIFWNLSFYTGILRI